MARGRWGAMVLAATLAGAGTVQAQGEGAATAEAEAVVRNLYDLVTFEAGDLPDWDDVRAAFLPEAVIVLRTAMNATSVFDVDGFIADWHRFIESANVEATGFSETILETHTTVMGDMALMWVLYEAHIPGAPRRQQGVDAFLLSKRADGWKIAAITNEVVLPNRPPPEVLRP